MRDADDAHLLVRDSRAFIGGHARVDHRQLDVFERARAREQIVGLKDEAEAAAANVGTRVAVEMRDVGAFEEILTGGRIVEQSGDLHERRLARARGAHDGDEFAGADLEIDARKRDDLAVAERVDFAQAFHAHDWF